VNPQIS